MREFVRLADHTTKIGSGQTPLGGEHGYAKSGIPLIRSQNILMGSFTREGLAYISDSVDESMKGSRVVQGDVLLNITGASIGRVCVVPDAICPANVNQHVCIIRCNESLWPEYVAAVLASPGFQAFIWESQAGGTRQALTKQMIEDFEIPWLSIDDQRHVANRLRAHLTEVEKAHQAAVVQLRDAELLGRRALWEAFVGLNSAPLKVLTDVLLDIQAGKSFQTSEVLARPDELGVLRVSAVTWSEFRAEEAKALMDTYEPEESHKIRKGDLLISRANTKEFVGAVVLVGRDYPFRLLSDKTLRLVVNEDRVCKEYLLFALRSPKARGHIERLATGTSDSMRNISQGVIKSIPFHLPKLAEQRQIAACLKAQLAEIKKVSLAAEMQLRDIEQFPNRILAQEFEN